VSASNPFSLAGQRILITGAAGGIGQATARLCAMLGAELFLTDYNSCNATQAAVEAAGSTARVLLIDLTSKDAPARLADFAADADAAVLGAGIYRAADWSVEDWDHLLTEALAVNLAAPARLARALGEPMAQRGRGRLIFIGSIVATSGGSFPGVGPHYAVSKGGLHTLVRWCASRFAKSGVQANGIAPGITDTAMVRVHDLTPTLADHPLGRAASVDEIAAPIAFLCSPGASFISGAILDVNGGAMMRP